MAASIATSTDRTDAEGASAIPSLLMQRLLPARVTGIRPAKLAEAADDLAQLRNAPAQPDWAGLLGRVQAAGSHIRDIKAATAEQDQRVEELLDQVRLDMKAASDQVRASENAVAEIHERATRQIKAAEDRANAAEQSARLAHEQFAALSRLIEQEFPATA